MCAGQEDWPHFVVKNKIHFNTNYLQYNQSNPIAKWILFLPDNIASRCNNGRMGKKVRNFTNGRNAKREQSNRNTFRLMW